MKNLSSAVRLSLVGMVVLVMFVLHNSFWLWKFDDRFPLLFGFMPFAFSYYVAYALLAVGAIALVVKLAWPDPPAEVLEPAEDSADPQAEASGRPGEEKEAIGSGE